MNNYKKTLILSMILTFSIHARNCKRDVKFGYEAEGTETIGKVSVVNIYKNGECTLAISLNNSKSSELIRISDQGKLTTTTSATGGEGIVTNASRGIGTRTYYLLPRKEKNVGYTVKSNGDIEFKLSNGEKMIISSKTGKIKDISNTKWEQDKVVRNYIKNGKVVAQDAFSKSCHNCGLKYKGVNYDKFTYTLGGIDIQSIKGGIVLDTGTIRTLDPRSETLWGKDLYTTFKDENGLKCKIANRYVYEHHYSYLPLRGKMIKDLSSTNIKFINDHDKYPTRKGLKETFPVFIKRVCVKNKGHSKFELSAFEADDNNCKDCDIGGKEGLNEVQEFGNEVIDIINK